MLPRYLDLLFPCIIYQTPKVKLHLTAETGHANRTSQRTLSLGAHNWRVFKTQEDKLFVAHSKPEPDQPTDRLTDGFLPLVVEGEEKNYSFFLFCGRLFRQKARIPFST